MKRSTIAVSCLLLLFFCSTLTNAQYCVPNTLIPYNANMPGITHVVLNTIDRTSADLENYPNNSYVFTGMSTNLEVGNTYTISVTHTVDAGICPDMNIRVYIDYNQDTQFNDAGETVISTDHHAPGTYTGTFTVPPTAFPGTTRMRVAVKMSNLGGHTMITPCDDPTDPLGFHGEMEDYEVNITSVTGVGNASAGDFAFSLVSPVTENLDYSFSLEAPAVTAVRISDLQGRITTVQPETLLNSGIHAARVPQEVLSGLTPGVYLLCLDVNRQELVRKFILIK